MRADINQRFPVKGAELSFDLFRRNTDEALPLLVLIHGGGWISGEKEDYRDEALWWASHGWAAVCVSYRLAPLFPFPIPIADVQRFLLFAAENPSLFGTSPGRTAVFGNSAGGHLALMTALAGRILDGDEPSVRPARAVAVCPITDMTDPGIVEEPLARGFAEQFMGDRYSAEDPRWADASPACQPLAGAPATLLVHGTADEIVPFSQSLQMEARLRQAGNQVSLLAMEGEHHAFSYGAWMKVREAAHAHLAGL
ncbi:MAG: alpha/beta hydrolase [Fimbriimonadaceae bacterium]|nr:alpha/beta hydrolase [Fimbriimonadaceae bacterium]QYK57122.1 MAG: alpha/beta hydrolase [Fimbriimonadaceae bacterium]